VNRDSSILENEADTYTCRTAHDIGRRIGVAACWREASHGLCTAGGYVCNRYPPVSDGLGHPHVHAFLKVQTAGFSPLPLALLLLLHLHHHDLSVSAKSDAPPDSVESYAYIAGIQHIS
jgi:hypothetical protein